MDFRISISDFRLPEPRLTVLDRKLQFAIRKFERAWGDASGALRRRGHVVRDTADARQFYALQDCLNFREQFVGAMRF